MISIANLKGGERKVNLVKYDPFDLRSFWRWPAVWDEEDAAIGGGLDLYETEHEVVVRASVAGVDPSKVDITFEKGILWIKGEQEDETREGKKFFQRSHRTYSYRIAVPGNVDLKVDPEAAVKNGVLELKFKKLEEAKPRKISVKTQ